MCFRPNTDESNLIEREITVRLEIPKHLMYSLKERKQ